MCYNYQKARCIMATSIKYLIVGLVATVLWEYGHPYIPGIVVDHPAHEHTH